MGKTKVPKQYIRTAADERAISEGCYFDHKSGERVIKYFKTLLRHSKGEFAGKPFELAEWEADGIIMPLYSWKNPDGFRRYRSADIWVPKKNGKTTLCAGMSLYHTTSDGESGAEVYSAANDREQASIVFRECEAMIMQSPDLSRRLDIIRSQKRIVYQDKFSFYKALSADVATKQGLNPSFVIIDEIHAMKSRELFDTLYYGGIARKQPLRVTISTAGDDEESIGYERFDIARKVIKGEITDPTIFAYVRAADPEKDDWRDPKVWKRVNPSYGITMNEKDFASDCEKAITNPLEENSFKRYRLNIWTKQTSRYIPMIAWDKNQIDYTPESMKGMECYGGLDLSSEQDLTSLVLAFPRQTDTGREVLLIPYFWIPQTRAQSRQNAKQVYYLDWARKGLLEITPGNCIDQRYIKERILQISKDYRLISTGYDPWNCTQLSLELQDVHGLKMVEFRQGSASMNEPTKNFLIGTLNGRIKHNGHELLRWCIDNMAVKYLPNNNVIPAKPEHDRSAKIDGAVASIMAVAMSSLNLQTTSVYEDRGLLTL